MTDNHLMNGITLAEQTVIVHDQVCDLLQTSQDQLECLDALKKPLTPIDKERMMYIHQDHQDNQKKAEHYLSLCQQRQQQALAPQDQKTIHQTLELLSLFEKINIKINTRLETLNNQWVSELT